MSYEPVNEGTWKFGVSVRFGTIAVVAWISSLPLHASPAVATPIYSLVALGLHDAEHTRSDGTQSSQVHDLNQSNYITGFSRRYNGGYPDLGQSAWLYDGSSTIDIGLTDAEHTRNDGYKNDELFHLNERGQVAGYSQRFNGGSAHQGWSSWLYDGEATIRIGLIGDEHTRDDGFRESAIYGLTASGRVYGFSERYNGYSSSLGKSAWLFNGSQTIDIGLTGQEHTRSGGYRLSWPGTINEAGLVIGSSERYLGGHVEKGQTAWLFNGSSTVELGLTGSEFIRMDGYRYSGASDLNELGQVSGVSYRYDGTLNYGVSAWLFDGRSTIELGLTDEFHVDNDGLPYNYLVFDSLNEQGQVMGIASRYTAARNYNGQSAWFFDGKSTSEIGLLDSKYASQGGFVNNTPWRMNEAGQVIGYSEPTTNSTNSRSAWLYDGTRTIDIGLNDPEAAVYGLNYSTPQKLNGVGQVAGYARLPGGQGIWFFDGLETIRVGLFGSEHTRGEREQLSYFSFLNDAGLVTGSSQRYVGSKSMGQDAWLYDSNLDQTFSMNVSTRSDGYAYSAIRYLGEDGLVLGTYKKYAGLGDYGVDRAFYFTVEDGFKDLGELLVEDIPVFGWERLAIALRGNGQGYIVGHGRIPGDIHDERAYLLVPIPEPAAIVQFIIAFAVASIGRRHRPRVNGNLFSFRVRDQTRK